MTVLDGFQIIERAFPDRNDPDLYECLAFYRRLLARKQERHADMLRATARRGAR